MPARHLTASRLTARAASPPVASFKAGCMPKKSKPRLHAKKGFGYPCRLGQLIHSLGAINSQQGVMNSQQGAIKSQLGAVNSQPGAIDSQLGAIIFKPGSN